MKPATAFATFAAAAAMLPLVAAGITPEPALIFGTGDSAVAYIATIFATVLIVFAPFAGWSMGAPPPNAEDIIHATVKNKYSILYTIPSLVWLVVKMVGQVALAVVFSGYILHPFRVDDVDGTLIDTYGNPPTDPRDPAWATWYVYIVIFVATAARLDMLAAEWAHRLYWFWGAVIVAVVETLLWGVATGFIIAEAMNLGDGMTPGTLADIDVAVPWETWLAIVSGVWFVVSLAFLVKYALTAWAMRKVNLRMPSEDVMRLLQEGKRNKA